MFSPQIKISETIKPAADFERGLADFVEAFPPSAMLVMPLQAMHTQMATTLKEMGYEVPEKAPTPSEAVYYLARNVEAGKTPIPIPFSSSKGEKTDVPRRSGIEERQGRKFIIC